MLDGVVTLSSLTQAAVKASLRRQIDELLNPSPWIARMMREREQRITAEWLSGSTNVAIGTSASYEWPLWGASKSFDWERRL